MKDKSSLLGLGIKPSSLARELGLGFVGLLAYVMWTQRRALAYRLEPWPIPALVFSHRKS